MRFVALGEWFVPSGEHLVLRRTGVGQQQLIEETTYELVYRFLKDADLRLSFIFKLVVAEVHGPLLEFFLLGLQVLFVI